MILGICVALMFQEVPSADTIGAEFMVKTMGLDLEVAFFLRGIHGCIGIVEPSRGLACAMHGMLIWCTALLCSVLQAEIAGFPFSSWSQEVCKPSAIGHCLHRIQIISATHLMAGSQGQQRFSGAAETCCTSHEQQNDQHRHRGDCLCLEMC